MDGLVVDLGEVILFSEHEDSMFYTCWWVRRAVVLWPVASTEVSVSET